VRSYAILAGLFTLFLGCSSARVNPSPDKVYRYDMKVEYQGATARGLLILPQGKKSYNFIFRSPEPADSWEFATCHRLVTQDVMAIGAADTVANYTYVPNDIEQDYCPVTVRSIGMYGHHTWALLDMDTVGEDLEATQLCNGMGERFAGVGMCQAREGLYQEITFVNPVIVASGDGCGISDTDPHKSFYYRIPRGVCVHSFVDTTDSRKARLTTIGYDEVLRVESQ
jgi:hypothetical protein